MSREKRFIRKLSALTNRLRKAEITDCEPFDGTFQVDGVPLGVQLKPNATIKDVERIANFSKENATK